MEISQMDRDFHALIRAHIGAFLTPRAGPLFDMKSRVLEIGPEWPGSYHIPTWDTLGLADGNTFVSDITLGTPIAPSTYDYVLLMEVLEHTVDPFAAIAEVRRLLKPGGMLLASAPFNAREHGPLPDAWRFSRHGWRIMLRNFDEVTLDVLMTPDRPLCPLHICARAICNKDKDVDPRTMAFPLETT